MSGNGLIHLRSNHTVDETMRRLRADVTARGIGIFAEIDHAAGAAEVHLPLRPTKLLIFGNAQAGTPLMQAGQTIGIDLPLKMLAWEDEAGTVWLGYNDVTWLAQRHQIGSAGIEAAQKLTGLLAALAQAATAGP